MEKTRDDENIENAVSNLDGQLLQILPVVENNDPNGLEPSERVVE